LAGMSAARILAICLAAIPATLATGECSSLNGYTPDSDGHVAISNSSTTIDAEEFASCCDNLTTIDIPGSVTSIGEKAFQNCDKLSSLNLPPTVTTIGRMRICPGGSALTGLAEARSQCACVRAASFFRVLWPAKCCHPRQCDLPGRYYR